MIPVRLGLVGAGPWGAAILRTLHGARWASLTRVASGNPRTALLVARRVSLTPDWRELVRAPDVDGVIIAAPPALHVPMAREALRAGKAVFVEKPLSLEPREARSLLALAARRKAFVLVDHVHLFHPAYEDLKSASGRFGGPRSMDSTGGNRGPFRRDTPPLWDYGPHDLAMALDLAGQEPSRVRARLEEAADLPEGRGENWRIELAFPSGFAARLRVGNLFARKRRRLKVRFARGYGVYDPLSRAPLVVKDEYGRRGLRVDKEPPLTRALKVFAEGIRRGSTDLSSLESGVRVVEILARCERAARRGRSG